LKKTFSLWAPVIFWCSLIFFLSSIPHLRTNLGIWDLILRKGAHLTEYAVLFLLLRRAFSETYHNLSALAVYWLSVLFAVLFAASDEFHQSFVPGRGPSVVDVGIDTVGVLIGLIIYLYWKAEIWEKSEIRISKSEKPQITKDI